MFLQRKLEDLLGEDEELRVKASKGKCENKPDGLIGLGMKVEMIEFKETPKIVPSTRQLIEARSGKLN